MKSNQFRIKVKTPCNENWNQMTLTERGKFCSKCTKEVIDLTRMSDKELSIFLCSNQGSICGRFSEQQALTTFEKPGLKKTSKSMWLAISLPLLLLISSNLKAQIEKPTLDTKVEIAQKNTNLLKESSVRVSGTVKDYFELPAANAQIYLDGELKAISDSIGEFSFTFISSPTTTKYEVIFKHVSYGDTKMEIDLNSPLNNLQINLEPQNIINLPVRSCHIVGLIVIEPVGGVHSLDSFKYFRDRFIIPEGTSN